MPMQKEETIFKEKKSHFIWMLLINQLVFWENLLHSTCMEEREEIMQYKKKTFMLFVRCFTI